MNSQIRQAVMYPTHSESPHRNRSFRLAVLLCVEKHSSREGFGDRTAASEEPESLRSVWEMRDEVGVRG